MRVSAVGRLPLTGVSCRVCACAVAVSVTTHALGTHYRHPRKSPGNSSIWTGRGRCCWEIQNGRADYHIVYVRRACACGQDARKMIDARVDVDVRPVSRYTIDYSHCTVYCTRGKNGNKPTDPTRSRVQSKCGGGGVKKSPQNFEGKREECSHLCIIDWHEMLWLSWLFPLLFLPRPPHSPGIRPHIAGLVFKLGVFAADYSVPNVSWLIVKNF